VDPSRHDDADLTPRLPEDSGLRCPACEYNLTGLDSARCPECGRLLDWPAIRRARDLEAARRGSCWERWPLPLKPAAFVATAFQAALLPWQLARCLPRRPPPAGPLLFLAICLSITAIMGASVHNERAIVNWFTGVVSHVLVQTLVFGLALPLPEVKRPLRFWLAVTCYTSWPLLPEATSMYPTILAFHRESNVWPFSQFIGGRYSLPVSLVYHLWWLDLAIIGMLRLAPRHRRRIVLLVVAVPVMTVLSSYSGCRLGPLVASVL